MTEESGGHHPTSEMVTDRALKGALRITAAVAQMIDIQSQYHRMERHSPGAEIFGWPSKAYMDGHEPKELLDQFNDAKAELTAAIEEVLSQ